VPKSAAALNPRNTAPQPLIGKAARHQPTLGLSTDCNCLSLGKIADVGNQHPAPSVRGRRSHVSRPPRSRLGL